jgi:hypothetical protein
MVGMDAEGGEEMGGVVIEVVDMRDEVEEVSVYVFFLGTPKFLTVFVDNSILVGMLVNSKVASRGSEEVREEVNFNGEGKRLGSRGWECGDRGDDDGWGKVLTGDILERDVLKGVVV